MIKGEETRFAHTLDEGLETSRERLTEAVLESLQRSRESQP